jgi:hypothetical protein
MVLDADEEWMALKFKDFTALSTLIFTDKLQSSLLDFLNEVRIDLVAMTVSFIHLC